MRTGICLLWLQLVYSVDMVVYPESDTSQSSFYFSIQQALENLSSDFTTIHLIYTPQIYNFTYTSSSTFSLQNKEVFIQTLYCSYLDENSSFEMLNLSLRDLCTNSTNLKATISYNLDFTTHLNSSRLTFQNVKLTGQHYLQGFCEDGLHWCSHCLTSDYRNGMSTFYENYTPTTEELEKAKCTDHDDRYVIGLMSKDSQLNFKNCVIVEFRHRFRAFVKFIDGGILIIEDSELKYLDFNSQGAFILYENSDPSIGDEIDVRMSNLKISRLNFDTFYKDSYSGDGGFIRLDKVHEIALSDIDFEDMLIFTQDSSKQVGLIQLANLEKSATFTRLNFTNVMGGGLGIIKVSTRRNASSLIECNDIPKISIDTVTISSSLVTDEGSYIFLSVADQHSTIYINNLKYRNIKSTYAYSLLNIIFPDINNKCNDYTQDYVILNNISIENTQINSKKASQLINLEKVKNMSINNMTYSNDIGVYAYDCMQWIQKLYLPQLNPNLNKSSIKQGTVSSMLNLNRPQNFSISNLWFNLTLGDSWHKFVIYEPYAATLNKENILNKVKIEGNGKLQRPMKITTNNEVSIKITNSLFSLSYSCLVFSNISNSGNKASLIVENTTFEYCNSNGSTGSALIYQGAHLEVRNCNFRYNNSTVGGGIYYANQHYLNQTAPSIFTLESSNFLSNIAFLSVSDLYVEAASGVMKSKMKLSISNCLFQDGMSYFNIGSTVIHNMILIESYIKNTKFINISIQDGVAVGFTFQGGDILVEDCEFTGNNQLYGNSRFNTLIIVGNGEKKINSVFNRCKFSENYGEAVILIHNRNSSPVMETKNCLFENNYTPIIESGNSVFKDDGSIFRNNIATANTIYRGIGDNIAYFNNSIILNNESETQTAGFSLEGKDNQLYLTNVIMKNNTANKYTVLFIDGKSGIHISNTTFQNNRAEQDTSTIHIENVSKDYMGIIDSSTFIENSGPNLISLYNSNLKIMNSRIERNISPDLLEPTILLQISYLELQNNLFKDHNGNFGCYVMSFMGSSIQDTDSIFESADCEYGAIYMLSSTLSLKGSSFRNSNGNSSIIYASKLNDITLENTQFMNNKIKNDEGSLVYLDKGNLTLKSVIVHDFNKYAFHINTAYSIILQSSYISNGGSTNLKGSGLYAPSCQYLQIVNSTFENISSLHGGAIYIESLNSSNLPLFIINSSRFIGNTAIEYGAVYLNGGDLNIKNSTFESNIATGIISQNYQNKGKGGALYLGCDEATWTCAISLSHNRFSNNSALSNGGAIYWDSFEPDFINHTNTFISNTAVYGNDTASYPVALQILSINKDTFLTKLDEVASGQNIEFEVVIGLVDSNGQVIANNDQETAFLSTENKYDKLGGQTVVQATQGKFIFKDFTFTATPGQSTRISVKTNAIDLGRKSQIKAVNVSDILYIHVNVRKCIIGEFSDEDACLPCPQQTYSFEDDATICHPCPDQATCLGGMRVYPKKDYWRSNKYSTKFFECPYQESCIGDASYTDYQGACAEGHKGNMCQVCEDGWSYSITKQCIECEELLYGYLSISAKIIFFIATSVFILRQSLNEVNKSASLLKVHYKILINYIQLSTIILTINLEWADMITRLFEIYGFVGDTTKQLFSHDCLVHDIHSGTHVFYIKLYAVIIYPFIIFLITAMLFCGISIYTKSAYYIKGPMVSALTILLFLAHPNVVSLLMDAFDCIEINENEYWVKNYMDIECWGKEHYNFTVFIVLPGLIIWGFMMPIFSLYFLSRNRKELFNLDIKVKYGFMYSGYGLKTYYWEFVIMFRKVILIMIFTFFSRFRTIIQGLLSLVVLVLLFYFQTYFRPFINDKLNRLEEQSILSSCVMVYMGLFYMVNELSNATKNTMNIVTLGIHGYFLVHWFISWWKVFINQIIEWKPMMLLKYFWGIKFIRQKCTKVLYEKKNEKLEMNKNNREESESSELEIPNIKEIYTRILHRKSQQFKYNYTMRDSDTFIY